MLTRKLEKDPLKKMTLYEPQTDLTLNQKSGRAPETYETLLRFCLSEYPACTVRFPPLGVGSSSCGKQGSRVEGSGVERRGFRSLGFGV